jgi:predicted RNA-binding protein (virulence factor B family)
MSTPLTISPSMILGRFNNAKIISQNEFGFEVQTEDDSHCLFPNKYITEDMKVGDVIKVFIYTDSEDRMVATTETPKAQLGEFALLEVVDITDFGAFMDWGIVKDLLVPRSAQENPYKVGERHVVRVTFDNETHRLIGVGKTKPFVSRDTSKLREKMEVSIIILDRTDLGYKVFVNNQFEGLIFHNEIFKELNYGDTYQAYIKKIRSDGKLDISLQAIGAQRVEGDTQVILDYMNENGGKMPYNSKSDAELIKKVFGLSKKSYKKALSSLREANKIRVEENGCFII